MRAMLLTGEHRAQRARVGRRVTAGQLMCAAQIEAVVRRAADFRLDLAGPYVEHGEGTERRGLIPALRAVDHEGALDGQPGQRFGHELRGGQVERLSLIHISEPTRLLSTTYA